MTTPVLQVNGLKKYFPLRGSLLGEMFSRGSPPVVRAVEDVGFEVREGEVLGVVGESGCGKTTTGLTTLKLYPPTAGEIRFLGQDIVPYRGRELREFRREAQLIFQDPYQSLNPRFTVLDTVREPLVIHGLANGKDLVDRVIETLDMVRLRPPEIFLDRYPHELSGGQRQRVAIARAMVLRPKFVVADEPVSMLDVSVRAGILGLLRRFSREVGLSILYISHDISTVRYLCDRTAIMYLGRIIETGPTEKIIDTPLHPYTRALLSAVPTADPQAKRQRVSLKGDVPSPVQRPTGCVFHPRCPEVFEPCGEHVPRLQEQSNGHFVACHLYPEEEKAPAQSKG
jgi:peptide/nickel transport system ATP-binding protein